jgi:hypothetical protein
MEPPITENMGPIFLQQGRWRPENRRIVRHWSSARPSQAAAILATVGRCGAGGGLFPGDRPPAPAAGERTMSGLGTYLVGLQLGLLLVALLMLIAGIAGLTGGTPMAISGLLVLAAWLFVGVMGVLALARTVPLLSSTDVTDDALGWTRRLLISVLVIAPLTGLGLAFLAFVGCGPYWVPGYLHWTGLVATVLAFLALFTLAPISRAFLARQAEAAPPTPWWVMLLSAGLVALLWVLAWLVPYLMLRGDIDESKYAAARSDLLLPWPGGEDSWVIQGNNSGFNHTTANVNQEFSWDFRRPCGTAVLAALPGTVSTVTDTNDGIGGPNNQISVTHTDGSIASYLHVLQGSASVTVGQAVAAGDPLASVGCVGNSLTGHIHFMVKSGATSIAVKFADVTSDTGIPRTFGSYTSGNRR